MSFKFAFALAIFFVFHSGTGFSQEVSLSRGDNSKTTLEQELRWLQAENFVWGASKYEQKVTEAPSSVSIITADEIKKYGYRTLADILRSIRGFYVTYDRNWNYIGVRGFNRPGDYNTRVLLLVDGHRINDNIFDQAYIGTTFIVDVDLIDRVEVIRGPSSSLYGNSAFFGVINVITRSAQNFNNGEIAGEYTRWNAYKGRLSYGHEFQNSMDVLVSGSIYDSEGQKKLYYNEFDDPATNNGIAGKADADKNYSFFAKTSYNDFTVQGGHINREKNVPTAAYEVEFNDSRFITIDQRSYLEMKYEHEFAKELDLMARLSYDRYQFDADYPFDTGINKDYAYGQLWSAELMLTKTFFEHHKFVAGGEYKDNLNQDQKNFDVEPHFDYLDDKRNTKNWALFFQDEFDILENFTVNAGVRYDHFETFGGTTNPRAAVIYNPFEDTVLKLLYGQAFRAPNAYEFYYKDDGESQKANPDLQPETIKTYEMVWEQQVGKNIRGTVSGFFYKINDLITQQTDPADDLLVFNNVEEIEAKGIETELEVRLENGIRGRFSYTFQETEDKSTGKILTNSPRHLVKYNLSVPLMQEKFFASIGGHYTGKRKTDAGNDEEGYFVANLSLFSENLINGLEISANIYNLFDTNYAYPGTQGVHTQDVIEQDGLSYRLKLLYRF